MNSLERQPEQGLEASIPWTVTAGPSGRPTDDAASCDERIACDEAAVGDQRQWRRDARLLTEEEQAHLLHRLERGGSILSFCLSAHCTPEDVEYTRLHDARLRERFDIVQRALHQQIRAKLYQLALKGEAKALDVWFRNPQPATFAEASPATGDWSTHSDDILARTAREWGLEVPPGLAD